MKKLKKIKLHQLENVMNDEEMKMVVGGNISSNDCPSGGDDTECMASCTVEIVYEGKTWLAGGSCHYSGIPDICACVVDGGIYT